jgi:TDG/mug DNA glycosylase family protein
MYTNVMLHRSDYAPMICLARGYVSPVTANSWHKPWLCLAQNLKVPDFMPRKRSSTKVTTTRPTKSQLQAAYGKKIPDCLADDLPVWFIGINPSLYSAAVGHHFGRPGNRFWPALHDGGFTPRLFTPAEDRLLPKYGCGLTNFVAQATARADELSKEDIRQGGTRLIRKIRRRRPVSVAYLGITSYRIAFAQPKAQVGWQENLQAGARVCVLPNPSGLNAHYQRKDFARLFRQLKEDLDM